MEIIIKDTFKIIPNTNGNYSCDINGNIRSNEQFSNGKRKFKINSRILIPFINNKEYAIVYLRINGKTEDWLVHRLVAKTWIPNPNNFPIINHKDNNPLNNSVENLEWCTYSYNILYAEKQGRRPYTEKMKAVRCVPSIWLYKPVSQYSFVKTFIVDLVILLLVVKDIINKHMDIFGNMMKSLLINVKCNDYRKAI